MDGCGGVLFAELVWGGVRSHKVLCKALTLKPELLATFGIDKHAVNIIAGDLDGESVAPEEPSSDGWGRWGGALLTTSLYVTLHTCVLCLCLVAALLR